MKIIVEVDSDDIEKVDKLFKRVTALETSLADAIVHNQHVEFDKDDIKIYLQSPEAGKRELDQQVRAAMRFIKNRDASKKRKEMRENE